MNIKLLLENVPCKYKLSGPLEKLVGKEIATKQEAISAIWEYIKVDKALQRWGDYRTKSEKPS